MFAANLGISRSAHSARPTSIPYSTDQPGQCEHQNHSNQRYKLENIGGPKLWRQMMVGFTCAALVGLLMFVLGSAFIADAVHSKYSVSIMLCIMGMVCGLIVLVGVVILGRLFISRKWRFNSNQTHQHPNPACFHTCSVIYTPSQEQYPVGGFTDQPPAYDLTTPASTGQGIHMTTIIHPGQAPAQADVEVYSPKQLGMPKPPKYSDVIAPIPSYGEAV